jgi:hypothetical protein
MRYGLVERKRNIFSDKGSWYWIVSEPEEEERVDEYELPLNSLFWWYPEEVSKEKAVRIMMDRLKKELAEEFIWKWWSYIVSKKSYIEQRKKDFKLDAKIMDVEHELPTKEMFMEESMKKFNEKVKNGVLKGTDEEKAAWIEALETMIFQKDDEWK